MNYVLTIVYKISLSLSLSPLSLKNAWINVLYLVYLTYLEVYIKYMFFSFVRWRWIGSNW